MSATDTEWVGWGIALMVALPLLVIGLGEVSDALRRSGRAPFAHLVDLLRRSSLLLLFVTILLRQVAGLPADHIVVKLVDTALWITLINVTVSAFNILVFEVGATDWRARAPRLLIDLARLMLVAIGAAFVVSQVWNVDLRGLLAALGVGSLVIGLALQETLSNVFAGIALISARQFKVGDWIRVGDIEGQVRSITWRSVTVGTLLGDTVIIPNNQIARERLRIIGADQGFIRVLADVDLAFEHPPEAVEAAMREAIAKTARVLADPPPAVRVAQVGEGGYRYRAIMAVREYRDQVPVRSEFYANLWYVAERRGIVMPARFNHQYRLPRNARRRRASPQEMAARLHRLDTLGQPLETLAGMLENAQPEIYRRGEALVTAGERCTTAYVILSGTCDAVHVDGGVPKPFDIYATGELVVLKAFFRGAAAPFSVLARSDVEVLALPIADLETAIAGNLHLAHEIERLMVVREEARKRFAASSLGTDLGTEPAEADRVHLLKELFRA